MSCSLFVGPFGVPNTELFAIVRCFEGIDERLFGPKPSSHLGCRGKTHLKVLCPKSYSEQTLEGCDGSYACLFRLFGRNMSNTKALAQS